MSPQEDDEEEDHGDERDADRREGTLSLGLHGFPPQLYAEVAVVVIGLLGDRQGTALLRKK